MVEPLIPLRFLTICTVTKEEYEQLEKEVVDEHIADPTRRSIGTRILARLLYDGQQRYHEVKQQIKEQEEANK